MALRTWVGGVAACALLSGGLAAQTPVIAPGASPAKAKELVVALAAKKLEAFAVPDPSEAGRFTAVLVVPAVELLVVSATYDRPSDIEYHLYHKDYAKAYSELRASLLAKKRIYVEDAFCDGLIPQPKKLPVFDSETMETEKLLFNGLVADPKRRNDTRISLEDYTARFKAADDRYTRLLTLLLDELKK